MVLQKAQQLCLGQASEIETYRPLPMLKLRSTAQVMADLYDATAQELYWLENGVSVSKQKRHRNKVGKEGTITDAIMKNEKPGVGRKRTQMRSLWSKRI